MGINEKLVKIQSGLKAPKSNFNKYGNYYYRSCEDILEGVKPLLKSTNTILVINDTIEQIADRIYVKATATLTDAETNESISNSAYARESSDVKGMADAQVTGAASSYARKYALNGLFVLDDTKDDDTDNRHEENAARAKATKKEESIEKEPERKAKKNETPPATDNVTEGAYPPEEDMIKACHERYDNDEKNCKALLAWAGVESIDELTGSKLITAYNKAIKSLKK